MKYLCILWFRMVQEPITGGLDGGPSSVLQQRQYCAACVSPAQAQHDATG